MAYQWDNFAKNGVILQVDQDGRQENLTENKAM